MDQKTETNLDNEFKRHLKILRPYLGVLLDEDVIDVCNAWIKKLSCCESNEKELRNKYVFLLCYQLAIGVLDEPFLKPPPPNELPPLHEDESSDGSLTEVEYVVINSESANTKILYDKKSPSQIFTDTSDMYISKNKQTSCSQCDLQMSHKEDLNQRSCEQIEHHNCSKPDNVANCSELYESYYFRANNLIAKLRELKKQNMYLHNELLKEKSNKNSFIYESLNNSIIKIDTGTITHSFNKDCNTKLESLKSKLNEIQRSRNNLIETVDSLQDKLDHFDEVKKHEIDELEAKHKLDIIKLRTSIREEVKAAYESKLEVLRKEYENAIFEMQRNMKEEADREQIILEKDKLLKMKENEICQLKQQIQDSKNHQVSVLNKLLDYSNENSTESVKIKRNELEKRLSKMEKAKNKCAKVYEAKIASLQREKHLAECSLQLQLMKQRAQIVHEVTDENQIELATALDKLENKYKDIVANMQATAVQRRIQDQIALESLIQAVCGSPNESIYVAPTNANRGQFSKNTVPNSSKAVNKTRDREIETLCNSNKVDNVLIGNMSLGEETAPGYCLDGEKLQQLFERAHIPQRDIGDLHK